MADPGGKGGWGSGEIETQSMIAYKALMHGCGKGGWGSGEIETGRCNHPHVGQRSGKGGWGSGEIETNQQCWFCCANTEWKGWMGLRRD